MPDLPPMTSGIVARLAAALLGVAGFAFVAREAWAQRDLLDALGSGPTPGLLVGAVVSGLVGMALLGAWWTRLCRTLSVRQGLGAFFIGQLAKYVPGGVWAVVGVGEAARQRGVPGARAYLATMLSTATVYVAGAVVIVVLAGPADVASRTWPVLVAGAVALGGLGLHPRILAAVLQRLPGRTWGLLVEHLPPAREVALAVAGQLPVWAFLGAATWLTARLVGTEVGLVPVVVATAASWLVGFLALPVPGGIGVREAVFVVMLPQVATAAAIAVTARVLFIVVDALGAVVVAPLLLAPWNNATPPRPASEDQSNA